MPKDNNFVNPLLAVLNTDGATIVNVKVNPANHAIKISDAATGSDNGPANALHDSNGVPTLLATSSADGVTPVPVYVNASGQLLTKST